MDELERLIKTLEIAMQEMAHLQDMKCVNCKYYGLGNCILLREVELKSGLCGDGWVEIDNPNEHYCADFEKI